MTGRPLDTRKPPPHIAPMKEDRREGTTRRFDEWVGRTRSVDDVLTAFPAHAMEAVLDRLPDDVEVGAPLRSGRHWLYFNRATRASDLGPDGHDRRGGFLPPVPLARRMWAGGRLDFRDPLRLGEEATRRSTILSVDEKEGRSGALVFVTVQHEVSTSRGVAVLEEQDLVYRSERAAGSPIPPGPPPPTDARPLSTFTTDPVALFRFSALTFNGHRIHYDHPYATQTEDYPGLVAHAPLLALLLLDAASTRGSIATFSYRAVTPAFCGEDIVLLGRDRGGASEFWATTAERGISMSATAEWRS